MRLYSAQGSLIVLLLMAWAVLPGEINAHQSTNAYITITVLPGEALCQWEVAVADLQHAFPLDRDQDTRISPSEVQASARLILTYAISRLRIKADAGEVTLEPADERIGLSQNNTYAIIYLTGALPEQVSKLEITYRALFDVDPAHRGLLRLEWNRTQASLFTSANQVILFERGQANAWSHFLRFVSEGAWHIWAGIDHILFLVALLLPSVVWRGSHQWKPVDSLRPALLNVIKVVTAFTVAHSITLSVALLGWVHPPARWVEATIALSVLLAALNNLRPVFTRGTWIIAFGFGLIHGFGFASVLGDLGLAGGSLAPALFGFNVGVELGQLAIVGAFVPIAYFVRQSWFYQAVILRGGSVTVGLVALIWIVERAFELKVLPF